MGQVVKVLGMVLTSMPIGDYDKRLVLLTKEKGKITAFVKGARRPNSQFIAGSQPFCFGEFVLYEGRTSYNITQMNITNYFSELLDNIEAISYGFYFCELANYITNEEDDEEDMLKLLYVTLLALSKSKVPYELIKIIFELKTLTINGLAPEVFQCVNCNNEDAYMFSGDKNGLFCRECSSVIRDKILICESTKYTLQYIITSPIEKLYNFNVSSQVLQELHRVMKVYMKNHIDISFKSLELLNKL